MPLTLLGFLLFRALLSPRSSTRLVTRRYPLGVSSVDPPLASPSRHASASQRFLQRLLYSRAPRALCIAKAVPTLRHIAAGQQANSLLSFTTFTAFSFPGLEPLLDDSSAHDLSGRVSLLTASDQSC